jgi:hypothetical protein
MYLIINALAGFSSNKLAVMHGVELKLKLRNAAALPVVLYETWTGRIV